MKHAIIPSLLLCACPGFDPLPVDPAGVSSSTGEPGTGSTSVPWPTPPKWDVPQLDLGLAEPTTGTSTGEHVPEASTGVPAPTIDLSVLRISEVLADPDGKDGAAGSPEFVEIVHLGAADLPLAGLVIAARGWPELRMGDLGLAEQILGPGDLLVISRLATLADLPVPTVIREGAVLRAAFADGGGLRNNDGAVALFDEQGNPGDFILYGAPQPPPWDDPAQWSSSAAAAADDGNALCRPDVTVDTNTADDWASCAPSPGALPVPADDTTGEPPLPATVSIVEVLANPPGAATLEKHAEFVEIVNLGPGAVDRRVDDRRLARRRCPGRRSAALLRRGRRLPALDLPRARAPRPDRRRRLPGPRRRRARAQDRRRLARQRGARQSRAGGAARRRRRDPHDLPRVARPAVRT